MGFQNKLPTSDKLLILMSSGMDSLICTDLAIANNNAVQPLYIHFGFPWEDAELAALRVILAEIASPALRGLIVVSVDGRALLGDNWIFSGAVPQWELGILTNEIAGRNPCLLALAFTAAARLDFDHVSLGITSHSYRDAQVKFLEEYVSALCLGLGRTIKLHTPIASSAPEEVASYARERSDIPWGLAFSCYRPVGHQRCGACYKCTETRLKREQWGVASDSQRTVRT